MDPQRWQKIKGIFDAASALEGRKRQQFLERACAGDGDLMDEVKQLLDSLENANSFMDHPAVADAPSIFEEKKTLVPAHTTGDMQNGEFVAGTILASRYRILGLIGRGGMGEVYKADDIKLSQTVALKFIPDKLEKDRAALERFHAEVRMARQVAHPNVCRVFDIGEAADRHFLSMEYIAGDDLSSLLKRIGRLPSDKAIEIARELCIGLSAIHASGILHRDFKPANVIIDGKGRARITDFGIAGAENDRTVAESRVGTPAYMAPELISGDGVSVRSDIYSLGLVLYEIFTGKPAFRADSLTEIIQKHRSETPTNPSEYVKDIDPLVESLIFQCLEKDPRERPPSALHVAMGLPGGNPLQVALEAGETPSPEMVAASPKRGVLRPGLAIASVAGAIILLAFCLYVSMYEAPHNRIPLAKSPEVLSERANEIATKLGHEEELIEKQYGFSYDYGFLDHARQNPGTWRDPSSGQPLLVVFTQRQSPRYIDVVMNGSGEWQLAPQTSPGMRTVRLDTRGRLVEFSAVPGQVSADRDAPETVDWSQAFSLAELDLTRFTEVDPRWNYVAAHDERRAWDGVLPDHPDLPIHIEAASLKGDVTDFRIIYPWTKPDVQPDDHLSTRDWIAIFLYAGFAIGVLLTAIFLARRNVKSGSADRKGAFKTGIAVLLLIFAGTFLAMTHVPAFFPEIDRFMHSLRIGLQAGATAWLIYLALEPTVRRNWPELVVSWNRLLVGDWRDPLVGRDVVVGTLIGIAHFALIYLGRVGERFFYGKDQVTPFSANEALSGLRFAVADILTSLGGAIENGLMFVCLLVIVFLPFRRRLFAALTVFTIMFIVELLFFSYTLVYVPITFAISLIVTVAIARFGLVATATSMAVFFILQNTPLTINFSAWYATSMFFGVLCILALLAYGLRVSVVGSELFPGGALRQERGIFSSK